MSRYGLISIVEETASLPTHIHRHQNNLFIIARRLYTCIMHIYILAMYLLDCGWAFRLPLYRLQWKTYSICHHPCCTNSTIYSHTSVKNTAAKSFANALSTRRIFRTQTNYKSMMIPILIIQCLFDVRW